MKNEEALLKNSRHLRAKFWYSEDDFFGQYINNCLGFPAGWSSLVFLSSSPWWSQSYIYHQNFHAYNYNRLLNTVVFYLFLHDICGVDHQLLSLLMMNSKHCHKTIINSYSYFPFPFPSPVPITLFIK